MCHTEWFYNNCHTEATRDRIGLLCWLFSKGSNKENLTCQLKLDCGHMVPEYENARIICEMCKRTYQTL